MTIGASQTLSPGDPFARRTILQWSFNRSNNASPDRCLYDIDEGAEVVVLVTFEILGIDPLLGPVANSDISALFLTVVIGTDTGRGGVVHKPIQVDLARGFQFSTPALSITVDGTYPRVEGVPQPDVKVNVSVGRGGHGCGCPTRTLPAPLLPLVPPATLIAIPDGAYSAVLLSPAAAPGARLLQYTLGGVLMSDSPITPETGVEAKVTPGAVYFAVSGAPVGSRVSFKLVF